MDDFNFDNKGIIELRVSPLGNLHWGAPARWIGMGVSIVVGLWVTPIIIKTLTRAASITCGARKKGFSFDFPGCSARGMRRGLERQLEFTTVQDSCR
jgi:hypothetical protein